MQALLKLARPAALAAIVAMAGCIKQDQTITVYPDGSGKIQLSATVLPMFAQMMKMGEGQGKKGGPSAEQEMFKGLKEAFKNVYWANLQKADGEDGSLTLSGTAYFEDINKVEMGGGMGGGGGAGGGRGGAGRKMSRISFKKDDAGGGHILEMGGESLGAGEELEKMPEEQAAQVKMMLQGFEAKVTVVMPGAIKSAESMKSNGGREATSVMTDKELMDIMDKKAKAPEKVVIVSAAPDEAALAGEIATFKKELAEAKAAADKDAGSAKKPEPKKDEKKDEGGEKKDGGAKKGQDF